MPDEAPPTERDEQPLSVTNWTTFSGLILASSKKRYTKTSSITCLFTSVCMLCIAALALSVGLVGLGVPPMAAALVFGYLSILQRKYFSTGVACGNLAASLCVISFCILMFVVWVRISVYVLPNFRTSISDENDAYAKIFLTWVCPSARSLLNVPTHCITIHAALGALLACATFSTLTTFVLSVFLLVQYSRRQQANAPLLLP